MIVYLASPGNQLQLDKANGKPVLISYTTCYLKNSFVMKWVSSFDRVLIDSGAYSIMNSGATVDPVAYAHWATTLHFADAWAGLDDIEGDWRKSLVNYKHGGFPTIHDTDPPELLDELIDISRQQGRGWIGVGLKPPRQGKLEWVQTTLERMPDDLHVHGWACGHYTQLRRFDSIDSTHWWREAMKFRKWMPWMTYGECLDVAIKKIERMAIHKEAAPNDGEPRE